VTAYRPIDPPAIQAAYITALRVIVVTERRKRRPTLQEVMEHVAADHRNGRDRHRVRRMLSRLHRLHGV
jgi:hypothetical protein